MGGWGVGRGAARRGVRAGGARGMACVRAAWRVGVPCERVGRDLETKLEVMRGGIMPRYMPRRPPCCAAGVPRRAICSLTCGKVRSGAYWGERFTSRWQSLNWGDGNKGVVCFRCIRAWEYKVF